ncbi:hypothetical protein CYD30_14655 [Kosakonia cowanii]|jgi:hypothetical protein|uniref:Uncharacterized protein n=1 Tax=Mixta tenebrionis TaxID=2562439 RepID=A0A506V117_9GAMM|nr:hypothetical protein [Mixta tenebrionis]TNL09048.1 hypothetical protein CYD30_14655 [Kosakonia cowanii]TPW39289.1 hypothetical protein FKM52_19425 [Mixta tenebrionis]
MSDTEKLTIEQKIEIARLATEIYMTEYQSGHNHSAAKLSRAETNQMSSDVLEIAVEKQKLHDIRTDFQHIYQTLETAIVGNSDDR